MKLNGEIHFVRIVMIGLKNESMAKGFVGFIPIRIAQRRRCMLLSAIVGAKNQNQRLKGYEVKRNEA
jgi:hypothetical protein